MNSTSRLMLIGGSAVAIVGLAIFGSYVSFYNTAVSLEKATTAQFMSNKNTYDAMWKTVKEQAQIPDKYKEDFKEVLAADTAAKYEGKNPMMMWSNDRNINLDPSIYTKLMTTIEAGRADFKRGQKELLDKQRAYGYHLESFGGSIWAGMSGFPNELKGERAPNKDMDGDGILTALDYKIVTSKRTEAAFESGEDEAIKVF